MAEGFAKMIGKDIIETHSCGSRPSGKVNEIAVASMLEIGYDMSGHFSKGPDDIPEIEYDVVVTMGCGDECPFIRGKQRLDWNIPDPKQMDRKQFRKIQDQIRDKVTDLIKAS